MQDNIDIRILRLKRKIKIISMKKDPDKILNKLYSDLVKLYVESEKGVTSNLISTITIDKID